VEFFIRLKTRMNFSIITSIILALSSLSFAASDSIHINQIGFYQYGPKIAVVVTGNAWRFYVKSVDTSVTYYSGELTKSQYWSAAGDTTRIADFSDLNDTGKFVLYIPGIGCSYPFRINSTVSHDLTCGLIKSYYYQRASVSLPSQYAGTWSRSEGHPDINVIIHDGAGSDQSKENPRKSGDEYSSPKGWYDAGDYGKYVVNAGITVYTLLALYEQFSSYFDTLSLNIPHTVSGLPDLLEEIKWEMDWLLTMQDPIDGGVYHKLTSLDFCGFVMPSEDGAARYFIGKGTAAAFDFAAICAFAYRIYGKKIPSYADSCLSAAKYAWAWGKAHPDSAFVNPSDVATGAYSNSALKDEQLWAAVELFLATGDSSYKKSADSLNQSISVPEWSSVGALASYSLAYVKNDSSAISRIVKLAMSAGAVVDTSPYRTVIYGKGSFYWGSNGLVANYGMLFIQAFLATGDSSYFNRAIQVLDYLMGRNAVGYSFVTGFGSKYPMNPHHRPSVADGIGEPVPGLLVGGPNKNQEDASSCGVSYPSSFAAKSWMDLNCAYACNEVAINWNAPIAYLAGAIEAIYSDTSYHVWIYKRDNAAPELDSVTVSDVESDQATISWITKKESASYLVYSQDSMMNYGRRLFSTGKTVHSVTATGLIPSSRYYFRIYEIDDYGNYKENSIVSFLTLSSSVYDGFAFDPSSVLPVIGKDLNISFTAHAGLSASVNYRIGGSNVWYVLPCNETDGQYTSVVPGISINSSGIIFHIDLASSTDTFTTQNWSVVPASLINFSDTIRYLNAYNMISFPSIYSQYSANTLLNSCLGDSSYWRYYGFSPDSARYIRNNIIRPGQGGWIYSTKNSVVSISGYSARPDTLFPVVLSTGWNIIGNPFPYPIYWENSGIEYDGMTMRIGDNAAHRIVRRQIFHYSDTTSDKLNNGQYLSNMDIISNDTTCLRPWMAYWVYSEKDAAILLLNPDPVFPQSVLHKAIHASDGEWTMKIYASVNDNTDMAVIGALSGASDGDDDFDSPRPPSINGNIELGSLNSNNHGSSKIYSYDMISPSSGKNHSWNMIASSGVDKAEIIISWRLSGNREGYVYLCDSVAGNVIEAPDTGLYRINLSAGETGHSFSIKVMPYKYASSVSVPSSWALHQAWPNPFRTMTRIDYSIPVSGSGIFAGEAVTVSVYDILGRKVRTLVNRTAYPGTYSVSWDGSDNFGKKLKQGLYVVHLSARNYSGSIKVSVID
jgi:endoglucanase